MAEAGWLGIAMPEEYDGAGASLAESLVVLEELGRALTPSPLLASVIAGEAVLHCDDEDAKARLLPRIAAGEIATAIRRNLHIVIVVLTDNDLALIRIKQEKKGNPIYGTPIREKGAIGGNNIFGAPVRSAENATQFRDALEWAFAAKGPVIVEAIVDSREYDGVVLKKDKP